MRLGGYNDVFFIPIFSSNVTETVHISLPITANAAALLRTYFTYRTTDDDVA